MPGLKHLQRELVGELTRKMSGGTAGGGAVLDGGHSPREVVWVCVQSRGGPFQEQEWESRMTWRLFSSLNTPGEGGLIWGREGEVFRPRQAGCSPRRKRGSQARRYMKLGRAAALGTEPPPQSDAGPSALFWRL